MVSNQRLTAHEVEAARARIRPFLPPTRLLETTEPGEARTLLKLESEQPTGSFKVRGALANLLVQPPSPNGFVAASAGNHGLGVAWAGQASGRAEKLTIFVPESAPRSKIEKLLRFQAELRVVGRTYDDAEREAREFERGTGARFIHAYDDPRTAAGQGTVAMEIHEALGEIGTLLVPVGGGGLISGCAAWIKERSPRTLVVGLQPDASPALSESIRLDRALTEYAAGPTLADGLAGGIGHIVFGHRSLIDEVVNVPESAIRQAIRDLHRMHGIRAEASGAIPQAGLGLAGSAGWPEPIVGIMSGSNIDDAVLAEVLG